MVLSGMQEVQGGINSNIVFFYELELFINIFTYKRFNKNCAIFILYSLSNYEKDYYAYYFDLFEMCKYLSEYVNIYLNTFWFY